MRRKKRVQFTVSGPNGKDVKVYPKVGGHCPWCAGLYYAGAKPQRFVIHTEPTCKRFDSSKALEFVQAVRKHVARGDA